MKSHSILLVSPRAYFREELRDLLLASGHRVRTVEDGLEALEVIRHNDLDLIVTDLDLPRMDGIELVANARDLRRRVRIVMFSTACPREREQMLRKMGVQWVGHPKTPQQAMQGIGQVLNPSSQGRSMAPIDISSRSKLEDAQRG